MGEDDILVFIHHKLQDTMTRKARYSIIRRTFGLVLGSKIKTKNQYIIHINHVIPLGRLKLNKDPRALSDKKWKDLETRIYNTYPTQEILGWYGIRDGMEAMLTEQDQRIHREFFTKSWQIIYLLDSLNQSSNLFYWDRDKLRLLKGYYEYQDKDTEEAPVRENRAKWAKRGLIVGSCAILLALGLPLLYEYYGKRQFENHNHKSIIEDEDTSGNMDKTPTQQSSKISEPIANAEKELEEYAKKIAQLESKLEEKEKDLQELKENIASEEDHQENIPSDQVTIYIIQRGDNLYKISQKFYDTEAYAQTLARINRIEDHRSLTIGSYIIIPGLEEIENME
ncbi:MAG: LysM peptidoglycan-binding domain-containing protein [Clostridiales bacterium]|nr:LysM peptidoglycan-binding domain-containing protein [Clostridiales bacterium]